MCATTARILMVSAVGVFLTAPGLRSQTVPQNQDLAVTAAGALEPGMKAALRTGQPVSFEVQSSWGDSVRSRLEESLGVTLSGEHRRGASRVLLGDPEVDADRAVVEVWFGRCETVRDVEKLKVRMYSFTFQRESDEWSLVRSARLGARESSCDGDLNIPPSAQAWRDIRPPDDTGLDRPRPASVRA